MITSENNYFEDFSEGQTVRHPRGRTVGEFDNHVLTHLSMNTAEYHFNEDYMSKHPLVHSRVVNGLVVISFVVGLCTERLAENGLAELGFDNVRIGAPTYHGDTLYAESEVLGKCDAPDRKDAGIVRFKIRGINQRGEVVMEGEWLVLVKRKAYHLDRDRGFKSFLKPGRSRPIGH